MNVPLEFTIIDKRDTKDFANITFSGYKKNDVLKQFEMSIINGNLEIACNWLVELHISGKMDDIWKIIFQIMSKNININNPNISSWIWLKYKKYNDIIKTFNKGYEYECRNNQEIRNLFVDIIVILVYSVKDNKYNFNKKIKECDLVSYKNKLKSKKSIITNPEIDEELKSALNEIVNDLFNIETVMYWCNWIEKIEKIKKKNKLEFKCPITSLKYLGTKNQNDWIWILWKIILSYSNDEKILNEINALYHIYLIKYKSSSRSNKQYILYHALSLLKEDINWNTQLIVRYKYRVQACCNINQLYKLKTYEVVNNKEVDIYEEINKATKMEINIKTPRKTKVPKINVKKNEKEKNDEKIMEKLGHFHKLVFYKLDKEVKQENKKCENEYKNIKLR